MQLEREQLARCISPQIYQELLITQTLSFSSYAAIPHLSHALCFHRVPYLKIRTTESNVSDSLSPSFPLHDALTDFS